MKIVYCTKNISSKGGTERVLANKANYLVGKGFDVSIVSIDKVSVAPFFEFDARVKFYSLECDDFFKYRGIRKKWNMRRNRKVFHEKMSHLLHEIKPDITISLFSKYCRYIYKINDGSKKIIERHFGKYKRAQYYAAFDKHRYTRFISYLYRRDEYEVVKHFDKFIVLTHEDCQLWGDLNNIAVIPNALTFMPSEKSDTTSKRVISLGRLAKEKRFDLLIEMWSQISKKHTDWKLVIYGNGDGDKLRALANSLGIEDSVEIHPAIKNVEKELVDSSIYALTSSREGFSLVLTEAMSCGLPVISFACLCGPRDIISNAEDGFLIEQGDVKGFVDKLSILIENDELRRTMGEAASTNALRFSEENVMSKWLDLFEELTKQD